MKKLWRAVYWPRVENLNQQSWAAAITKGLANTVTGSEPGGYREIMARFELEATRRAVKESKILTQRC